MINMKRFVHHITLVCILAFAPFLSFAQGQANCNNFNDWGNRGKEYAPLFIPSDNDSIMNVRINLIFIQKDDGTGNFQENDEEHQKFLNTTMTILNNKVANLQMPDTDCFIGTEADFIDNIRIKFIDHRYYVPKSSVWNNNMNNNAEKLCPDSKNWYLNDLDDSLHNTFADTLKGINIFFTEDSSIYHRFWILQDTTDTSYVWQVGPQKACSEPAVFDKLHASSRIHMPCRYSKYWWVKHIVPQLESEGKPEWYYKGYLMFAGALAGDLAHELGHSFNLLHPTNDYYLPYHSYPQYNCIATIMNPHASSSPRNFLPPQEIGLMYFTAMTTNLQQFIPSNTYLGEKILNTIVSLPQMRMYYSLLIGSSGDVTMPCDLTFSTRGHIEVQNGGVLSIEGATLQSIKDTWGGITVQSGGIVRLSNVVIGDYNITVEPGGCLIVDDDLTITGDHSITIEDDGYLCITSDASVNLQDEFSLIIVSPNAHLGGPSCTENCISTISDLSNSGNGHYVLYGGTEFVQDTTIISGYLATGDTVYAGYDVTEEKMYGNVIVEDGGELRIKANETILTKDVEVKLGGTLLISK